MILRTFAFVCTAASMLSACKAQQVPRRQPPLISASLIYDSIIRRGSDHFRLWMQDADQRNIQIRISSVLLSRNGPPVFQHYDYHISDSSYFYPASTVKLPVVLLAYEKLNRLKRKGITEHSPMYSEAIENQQWPYYNNPDAPDGSSSIYINAAQILLVSDNEAYNRLYDFVGPEEIQQSLVAKGLNNTVIRHRLNISQPVKVQRTKPAVYFPDSLGHTIYSEPQRYYSGPYPEHKVLLGQGYMKAGKKVMAPFEFTYRNRVSLTDLHDIMLRLAYPESFSEKERFLLTPAQRNQLLQWMEMPPSKGMIARYKTPEFYDAYCKFLYYGAEKVPLDSNVQIRNKVGDAYGFLTDVAWFTNRQSGKTFFITATISCNPDGIYNDNVYDYEQTGFPFMKELGLIVYQLSNEGQIP